MASPGEVCAECQVGSPVEGFLGGGIYFSVTHLCADCLGARRARAAAGGLCEVCMAHPACDYAEPVTRFGVALADLGEPYDGCPRCCAAARRAWRVPACRWCGDEAATCGVNLGLGRPPVRCESCDQMWVDSDDYDSDRPPPRRNPEDCEICGAPPGRAWPQWLKCLPSRPHGEGRCPGDCRRCSVCCDLRPSDERWAARAAAGVAALKAEKARQALGRALWGGAGAPDSLYDYYCTWLRAARLALVMGADAFARYTGTLPDSSQWTALRLVEHVLDGGPVAGLPAVLAFANAAGLKCEVVGRVLLVGSERFLLYADGSGRERDLRVARALVDAGPRVVRLSPDVGPRAEFSECDVDMVKGVLAEYMRDPLFAAEVCSFGWESRVGPVVCEALAGLVAGEVVSETASDAASATASEVVSVAASATASEVVGETAGAANEAAEGASEAAEGAAGEFESEAGLRLLAVLDLACTGEPGHDPASALARWGRPGRLAVDGDARVRLDGKHSIPLMLGDPPRARRGASAVVNALVAHLVRVVPAAVRAALRVPETRWDVHEARLLDALLGSPAVMRGLACPAYARLRVENELTLSWARYRACERAASSGDVAWFLAWAETRAQWGPDPDIARLIENAPQRLAEGRAPGRVGCIAVLLAAAPPGPDARPGLERWARGQPPAVGGALQALLGAAL